MKLKFRNLYASEIEARVGQNFKSGKGCSILLYKDARVDQNLLDEVVGPMNWKKEYSRDNANCTVSIWDEDKKQWVSKEDTGTESNTEALKGLASDSFKRSCVCWGIGRSLYSAPQIVFFENEATFENGKTLSQFEVDAIEYAGDVISSVTVTSYTRGKAICTKTFKNKVASTPTSTQDSPKETTPKTSTPKNSKKSEKKSLSEVIGDSALCDYIASKYSVASVNDLDADTKAKVYKSLDSWKSNFEKTKALANGPRGVIPEIQGNKSSLGELEASRPASLAAIYVMPEATDVVKEAIMSIAKENPEVAGALIGRGIAVA